MDDLKSEIAFPKKERKIMGIDDPLMHSYANALTLAETDLKESNRIISELKSVSNEDGLSITNIENKLKKVIIKELEELVAETGGAYEEGYNGGIIYVLV